MQSLIHYVSIFLFFIEKDAYRAHFERYFLAQQLNCVVRAIFSERSRGDSTIGADLSHEERREDSSVMLSAAKHLDTERDRLFAAAQGDTVRQLNLVRIGGP